MRLDNLRRGLKQALEGQRGTRVVAPRLTARQAARGEDLLQRVISGGEVVVVGAEWEVDYPADDLPSASSPAWSEELHGGTSIAVAAGVLTLEDTG